MALDLVISRAAERSLPNDVAGSIEMQYERVVVACAKRIGPRRHDEAAIGSCRDRRSVLDSGASIGLLPDEIAAGVDLYDEDVYSPAPENFSPATTKPPSEA